eukprot:2807850-Amphidinium_carterae.1
MPAAGIESLDYSSSGYVLEHQEMQVTTTPPWLHDGCEEDEWQDMVLYCFAQTQDTHNSKTAKTISASKLLIIVPLLCSELESL